MNPYRLAVWRCPARAVIQRNGLPRSSSRVSSSTWQKDWPTDPTWCSVNSAPSSSCAERQQSLALLQSMRYAAKVSSEPFLADAAPCTNDGFSQVAGRHIGPTIKSRTRMFHRALGQLPEVIDPVLSSTNQDNTLTKSVFRTPSGVRS